MVLAGVCRFISFGTPSTESLHWTRPVHALRAVQFRASGTRGATHQLRKGDAAKPMLQTVAGWRAWAGTYWAGKTTASTARLLNPSLEAAGSIVRLRSDVERKRLFGLASHENSNSAADGGIYTAEATTRTYARLLALARELLAAGWPVIVDAAFLKRTERDSFAALAAELGVGFKILATEAPPEELHRRLLARSGDASEATVAILERQLAWFEPPDEEEQAFVVRS